MNDDLISRSALETVLERYYQAPHVHVVGSGISKGIEMGISGCLSLLDKAPAVDAVEVVRCKDCEFRCETDDGEYNPEDIVCTYWATDGLKAYDFCSRSKRRADDD